MFGFNRLSIQSKMILLLLAVSLTSIGVMAWIGYSSARPALIQSVQNELTGVRVAKTTTLKMMIASLRQEVILLAGRQSTIDGMRELRDAYRQLDNTTLSATESQQLDDFYLHDFLPKLDERVEGTPILEQYLPTRAAARYLQSHYIVANPHPYGKRQNLIETPSDTTPYGIAHAQHHKIFARAAEIFGFEDLQLVDAKTLDIVYSYQKTTELGSNLETGPYANTKLGNKVRSIMDTKNRDDFRIAGYEPWRPNLGAPEAFVMSPIFSGAELLGILVLQFPINDFNKVLTGGYAWREEGLGKTGEVYLVGSDKTIRSESRFMHEDPQGFLQTLRQTGVPGRIVDKLQQQGNPICVLPVETASVDEALRGHSGIHTVTGYRGTRVLSAYGPLDLDTLRWAVIAEIDEQEAQGPIRAFGRTVLVVATGMALAVTLLALFSSYVLTRPLRLLTEGAQRLSAGEAGVRVNLHSNDEFGELGRVFNDMSENIKKQTDRLEQQVRENQELLLNILPASAVAQWRQGDEKASHQFADVSVLFAKIIGLEAFGEQDGDTKALATLCDLIEAFDEAAEKSGIEKVKTIGGSYLAVCGLSFARPDHARHIIMFAQEMVRIVGVFNRDRRTDFSIAIGINAGPVVGGVVGRRKFLYDLWGDTVTIAKRLAEDDRAAIRITGTMRERVGEQFKFSGPAALVQPGKPPLDLWEVTD
ncbi:adenylate/guanylate cyclase domain-containing protein [uncultured Thiodictyon sp.]|uniref:adenylate/guanylate cyclase domain-containing protein n=1 Tax=uncultured Thiodictyon sp. TaxID=1846217 RepID=UPI0025EBA534|nr:adenylate/guanylate cyclase domain-containing protein [uncultured Thiodictyon sp.]